MGNPLILVGILLILAGIFANIAPQTKFPLLPGDMYIQKEGFTLYVPFTSAIFVSIILALVSRFLR